MILAVEPGFSISIFDTMSVSVLVRCKNSNKGTQVVNKSVFDYFDKMSCRAFCFDYLDFSHLYPLVSGIRAWVSLLFLDNNENDGVVDVNGIVMDFCDVAKTKDEVLWLFDLLNWN
ncbi:F-box protein, partial [Cucurbita argyrosperma subsp. sororia]